MLVIFVLCVAVCLSFLVAAWFVITAPTEIGVEQSYKLARPTLNGLVDWNGAVPTEALYGKELLRMIQTSWSDLTFVMPSANALMTHCESRLAALAMTEAKLGMVWSNLTEKQRFSNALLLLSWVEFNKELHARLQTSDNCKETCEAYANEMYESLLNDDTITVSDELQKFQALHRERRDMINATSAY